MRSTRRDSAPSARGSTTCGAAPWRASATSSKEKTPIKRTVNEQPPSGNPYSARKKECRRQGGRGAIVQRLYQPHRKVVATHTLHRRNTTSGRHNRAACRWTLVRAQRRRIG